MALFGANPHDEKAWAGATQIWDTMQLVRLAITGKAGK